MEYRIEFVLSAQFIADTARRKWLRRNGVAYAYYLGIPLVTLGFCTFSPEIGSSNKGSFCEGVLAGISALLLYQLASSLLNFRTVEQKIASGEGRRVISAVFNDEGIVTSYKGMGGRYCWTEFVSLWQQPQGWLLYYGEKSCLALPASELNADLRQFIVGKIAEVGGVIHQ